MNEARPRQAQSPRPADLHRGFSEDCAGAPATVPTAPSTCKVYPWACKELTCPDCGPEAWTMMVIGASRNGFHIKDLNRRSIEGIDKIYGGSIRRCVRHEDEGYSAKQPKGSTTWRSPAGPCIYHASTLTLLVPWLSVLSGS